ncbi:MAG: hypothetical protein QW179_01720 [Candidatus Hadarchaeales archaeon]
MEGLLFIAEGKALKIFILDTSAIIGGFTPSMSTAEILTVKEVLEEARATLTKLKMEAAIASEKIKIREPSPESLNRVEEEVRKTGDRLSTTDIRLLALALDHREDGMLLTDDYAIQNIAVSLGIRCRSVVMKGIKARFIWRGYCVACKKWYLPTKRECEVCGSKLLRKPRRVSFYKKEV